MIRHATLAADAHADALMVFARHAAAAYFRSAFAAAADSAIAAAAAALPPCHAC